MSEWAYYFCRPCPVGYSSLGGQTLNPYGRKVFESGGSSSGSGVSIAANLQLPQLVQKLLVRYYRLHLKIH